MFKKHKSPLKATRLHKYKRRVLIAKVSTALVLALIVVGGFAWFSRAAAFRITSVSVSGNKIVDADMLQALAEKDIDGAYAGLFARSNSFIFPKNKIEDDALRAFPSINSIDIHAHGHVLEIKISERKPAYVWCSGMPGDTASRSCSFMDDTGFIFSDAPDFSNNVYFIFYGGISADHPTGQHFLSPEEIAAFAGFKTELDRQGIVITSLVVRDDGVREAALLGHGKIIFKASDDLLPVAHSLELLKRDTQILSPKATTTLDYIDLRFGNKVYYK